MLKAQCDVWSAFIYGMLGVLPPQVRVIDGDERVELRGASVRLIDPANVR